MLRVGTLAVDDANNRELGRSGACAAVVKALNSFGNINQKVAENGCYAVSNLAFDEGNRQEFGVVLEDARQSSTH